MVTKPTATIVPAELVAALAAPRGLFNRNCDSWINITAPVCFLRLHNATAGMYRSHHRSFRAACERAGWQMSAIMRADSRSGTFKTFFDLLCDGIRMESSVLLDSLLIIASAQRHLLKVSPTEWALDLAKEFAVAEKASVVGWIETVCDRSVSDEWHAPGFIGIPPAYSGTPFKGTGSRRFNATETRSLLEHFGNCYARHIENRLVERAGWAEYVHLTSEPMAVPEAKCLANDERPEPHSNQAIPKKTPTAVRDESIYNAFLQWQAQARRRGGNESQPAGAAELCRQKQFLSMKGKTEGQLLNEASILRIIKKKIEESK